MVEKTSFGAYPLTIEISYRQKDIIKDEEIVNIDGINTYKINKLFELKLNAFKDRDVARDIYDLNFILNNYYEELSLEQKKHFVKAAQEKDLDVVCSFLEDEKTKDALLRNLDVEELESQILEHIYKIEEELE